MTEPILVGQGKDSIYLRLGRKPAVTDVVGMARYAVRGL